MSEIRRVAVIGAGVMGAGIAAHVANAGVPVRLLDVAASGPGRRSAVAEGALARLLKADPAPFMHPRNAALVTPGNIDDDLATITDCDWIIEAVVERGDVKRALYARIDAVRRPGSIVSSNTSTIPLAELVAGLPERFAADFLVTHFFNPPRYLRLLEVVAGPRTRPAAVDAIRDFADRRLGKTVVPCRDTPGFIANRIGIYWLQAAVRRAIETGLDVETADAVLGRPARAPKSGIFGLLDLVGLDLMPHVLASMRERLPQDDPFHGVDGEPELVRRMIADGYTGRKGKGGFYRLKPDAPGKVREALDLKTGAYRPIRKRKLASVAKARRGGLKALLTHPDEGGRYAWWVLARTLSYAAGLVPTIADDVVAVDTAMRLGYNWSAGPFEIIDELGTAWFAERLRAEGLPVPALIETAAGRSFYRTQGGRLQHLGGDGVYRDLVRPAGVLLLADVKRRSRPLARNRSASLWDIGDGVLCLEFHSKMNALNPLSLAMIRRAVRTVPGRYRALVVYNEAENFSVGANIGLLLLAMKLRAWFVIDRLVRQGQDIYRDVKYAPFPVVAAPSGLVLGGGCELLLHCDAVQAHAETYVGLVEAGLGVLPAWGGCKELLLRWSRQPGRPGGPMPPVIKSFETIAMARVARSAAEAKELLFLREGDGITMNRDRLLADAKAKALALADAYRPAETTRVALPGRTGFAALAMAVDGYRRLGKATAHDVTVGRRLAGVLSGGDTDMTESLGEDDLLALERQGFLALARQPASIARVAHMLRTGKPLRN